MLTVIDLFCGAGGLSEGFRQAGFVVLAGTDNDPDACATYRRNFPEAATITGDMRAREVHEAVLAHGAGADVVIGGPPCQAFSQVRNHTRLIDDPRNALYREFVAAISALRPAAFMMENVPGLEQMGVREQVTSDLSLAGAYRVNSQVVDAADFGVPQTRRRILFIGTHADTGLEPPLLLGSGASQRLRLARTNGRAGPRLAVQGDADYRDRLADPEDIEIVSVSQALSDLASLARGSRAEALDAAALPEPSSAYQRMMREAAGKMLQNVSVPRMTEDTALRLLGIPPGGNHRDLEHALRRRFLTDKRWGQDNGSGQLSRRHYYAYRRLHPDLWSWTLNTKADSVYHYEAVRALSVREFARLQSFPDGFAFFTDPSRGPLPGRIPGGSAHSRYRQVGNAVPPRLAAAVATELLKLLTVQARDASHAT